MEQHSDLGAPASECRHAFRSNLVAEPTRISAAIVGAEDGIYYDFNGTRHFILREEIDDVERTGSGTWIDYAVTPFATNPGATVSELLELTRSRPSPSLPGIMPINYADRYSEGYSKYLHWHGYVCGGRRLTDRVAELHDVVFADRVLRGDPKVCSKCKVRWRATQEMNRS